MARDSREVWERRVRRWERSGLTAADFSAREGVNPRTLSFWRWKLGPKAASSKGRKVQSTAVDFVEVVPHDRRPQGVPVEVVVERFRVRIERGADDATLGRVLDALRGGA